MKESNRQIQENYYAQTALHYDSAHLSGECSEHDFALRFLSSCIEMFAIQSILDVGAGTGRTIQYIRAKHPQVKITGIEPVKALREQAYAKGIPPECLLEGYGEKISFADSSFDLVCEFGVLHHVPKPELVVKEMLRVGSKGIFISDSNNFGQGGRLARTIKQLINAVRLWRFYNFIRTKGKMYQVSAGDGLYYSYSVFNNYRQIKKSCKTVHLLNTKDGEPDLYRSAPHIVLFGLKTT